MTTRRAAALACAALLLGTAGCADGGDDEATGGPQAGGTTSVVPQPGRAPGFDGATIRLGAIATAGSPGQERILSGMRTYFDALNAAGGIAGAFPVELAVRRPAAAGAPAAYAELAGEVALFALVLGDDVVTALLPALEDDEVVATPGSPSAGWIGEQQLLPIGSPFEVQAANAVSWYAGGGSGGDADDDICALTAADGPGAAGLAGLEVGVAEAGAGLEARAITAAGPDQRAPIGALEASGCDMVYLAVPAPSLAPVLAAADAAAFTPLWIAQSSSWDERVTTGALAPYVQEHVVVVGEGTEWGDTSVPGMAQLVEDAGEDVRPGLDVAYGYALGRAVRQVLEAAVSADDLSRAGIVAAMNSLPELTFDGLAGDYTWGPPPDRRPPELSTIFSVDPAVPGGLAVLERDVTSPAAADAVAAGRSQ